MRPTAPGPPPGSAPASARATPPDEGRRQAWRAAELRARQLALPAGPGEGGGGGGPAPFSGPAAREPAPAAAEPGLPASGAVERAGVALALLRHGDRLQVEVAAGPDLRYALGCGPGGVEIQARAAPPLERVARADLHAVADALRRRGVPLSRATVAPSGPAALGGRVDLPRRGR